MSVLQSPRPPHCVEPLIDPTSITPFSHVRFPPLRIQVAFLDATYSTSSTSQSWEWRARESSMVSHEPNRAGLFDGVVSSVSSHLSNILLPVDPVGDHSFITRRMIHISRCILRLNNNITCFCRTSPNRPFQSFNPLVIVRNRLRAPSSAT